MIERAVERILDSENVRGMLQDEDAQWLIDWGIEQIRLLLKDVNDQDVADETTYRLMLVMRALNRFGAEESNTPENVHTFVERYAAVFGQAKPLTPADEAQMARALASKSPVEAMQSLIEAVKAADHGNPPSQTPSEIEK